MSPVVTRGRRRDRRGGAGGGRGRRWPARWPPCSCPGWSAGSPSRSPTRSSRPRRARRSRTARWRRRPASPPGWCGRRPSSARWPARPSAGTGTSRRCCPWCRSAPPWPRSTGGSGCCRSGSSTRRSRWRSPAPPSGGRPPAIPTRCCSARWATSSPSSGTAPCGGSARPASASATSGWPRWPGSCSRPSAGRPSWWRCGWPRCCSASRRLVVALVRRDLGRLRTHYAFGPFLLGAVPIGLVIARPLTAVLNG